MRKVACLTCRPSPHSDDFLISSTVSRASRGSLDKGLLCLRHRGGSHLGVVEHGVVAAAVVVLAGDDHVVGPVAAALLLAGGVEGVGRDDGAAGAAGG